MKTHIKDILKNGINTKIKRIDYSSPKKRKELALLKKQQENTLNDLRKPIADFIINK